MKKWLLGLLGVLAVAGLAAGGYTLYQWRHTGPEDAPQPGITVQQQAIAPCRYVWNQPLLKGLLYKELSDSLTAEPVFLGILTEEAPALTLSLPEGYASTLILYRDGEEVFRGAPDAWDNQAIAQNGHYALSVRCELAPRERQGYGFFEYQAAFAVDIPEPEPEPSTLPSLETGPLELRQGDILPLRFWNPPDGAAPTVTTDLGTAIFTPREDGAWDALVPIGNSRLPGEYPVRVTAGELVYDVAVQVVEFPFQEQNLIIDTTSPTITEANSPEAYQQYREKIPPLFYTWDETRYWEGRFSLPVEGRITTEFGEIRYTNSDYSNPRSHNGMDIAAAEGTPVHAPGGGRVVLAENLLNTGNTLVIEHGGGLKSYYFHLSKLQARAGSIVQKGDLLGAVGTTGYSTGPHLHFEMRIGDQPVSPSMLLEDGAGMYSLENLEEAS